MKVNVFVHEPEEAGFWAEIPAIPGYATQGETLDKVFANLREAIDGCLSVDNARCDALLLPFPD